MHVATILIETFVECLLGSVYVSPVRDFNVIGWNVPNTEVVLRSSCQ